MFFALRYMYIPNRNEYNKIGTGFRYNKNPDPQQALTRISLFVKQINDKLLKM